jgi:transposase
LNLKVKRGESTSATMAKNQVHAEMAEAFPNPSSLHRIKAHIKFLDKQVAEILKEITELVAKSMNLLN